MPAAFTTLLKLIKSEIGGNPNDWGDNLNAVIDALDQIYRDIGGDLVTGGSANAYSISPAWADIAALADGVHARVRIHAANTDASTFNYDGLGVIAAKKKVNGVATALVRGDLPLGHYASLIYSETDACWIVENPCVDHTLVLRDWVDVQSASTCDVGAAASAYVHITAGAVVTIASFGNSAPQAGYTCFVRFDGGLTLIDSADLILGGENINPAAGTSAQFKYEGSGDDSSGSWRLISGFSSVSGGGGGASLATAAEIWAGTSTKAVGVDQMQAALVEQTLTDGATVTVNFAAGINFKLDTIGGNRTLAAASIPAAIVGRSGYIRVKQDGTGSRTLAMTASPFVNINGQNLVISTAAAAEDIIPYSIISTSKVLLGLARAIS